MTQKELEDRKAIKFILLSILWICFFIFVYFNFISPVICIWKERMAGQAELARAESNRQIATLEALAKKESSKALADAEVIRADGVAKANKIIGDSLTGNEGYLRYLYITHISDCKDKTIIYIPTEAALPILETQRLK